MSTQIDWKTAPIAEWPIEIVDGDRSSNYPKDADFVDDGVPFFNTGNVSDGRLDLGTLKYVTSKKFDQIRKGRLVRGDVIMTTRGTIGRVARFDCHYNTGLINAQMLILRPDQSQLSSVFLFYSLRSSSVQAALKNFSSGSAQPQIPIRDLRCVPISAPPIEQQRRIASILGAYDDLIEANLQRVALMEDMARGLFEDWFIRLRFPGHEDVPLQDTSDGPLPLGWAPKVVGDVTSYINRGLAPKYDETSSSMVINQKCIRNQRLSLRLARKQSKAVPMDKVVRTGDILINSTGVGTLGRVAQVEQVPHGLTADSHVTIVRPRADEDRDFVGMQLLRFQPLFEEMGTGATGQTELSRMAVGAQPIIWPTTSLRTEFGQKVRPLRILVATLLAANEGLAASRDFLLPRLISGQLSVAAAERDLMEAA